MDRTEVTNAEYAEFVLAMNYEAPSHWVKGKPLPGQELWPVVNVSAEDAQAFAAWRSKTRWRYLSVADRRGMGVCGAQWRRSLSYPWGDGGRKIVRW